MCIWWEEGETSLSKIHSTTGNQNVHLEVYFVIFIKQRKKEIAKI